MKKIILTILIIVVLAAAFVSWKVFGPTISDKHGKFFYVHTGEIFQGVEDSLVANGFISSPFWFDKISSMIGYNASNVKPGKYKINNGMSLFNLVRILKNGRQTPVNLVITKLRTKEDFAKKAGSLFEFDSVAMMNFLNNADSLKQFGLDTNTMMTVVIPDTYTYFWNTTPKKVLQKLNEYSEKFWNEERRKKASDHGLSPAEVYTLASIIEEETNAKEDKGNIASVYLNRIGKGMPLQADPTVKFALKDFGLKRIYFKHLEVQSPYNTYRNKGLPPGPVCTPSQETIDEVLNSPKTDYLYFVASSDLSGKSVFAADYDEHMKFAREYQAKLNKLDSARKAKQATP